MSIPNRINAALDTAAAAAVTAKITEIQTLLPFLIDLSPEERQSLPKMGDKSRAFVERCLELARQDDSFLPRNLDVSSFGSDVALFVALEPLRQRLAKLLELLEDTQILAGSEAYLAALDTYHAAKRSGKGSGLDDLLDRVGQRFANRRTAQETP
jgi:hypothetical protein